MHVNLLPTEIRQKIQTRMLLRRWIVVWAVSIGLMSCYYTWQTTHLYAMRSRLDLLTTRCRPLHTIQREITEDIQRLKALESDNLYLQGIKPISHEMELLNVLVQATRPLNGRLQIQRMILTAAQPPLSPAAAPKSVGGSATNHPLSMSSLSLQGVVDEDIVLARFVAALRESGIFERVELKSASRLAGGIQSARQYQLDCRFGD